MRRKRNRLSNRSQRPVMSDTLPFEVPPSFSNRNFGDVLIKHHVRIRNGVVSWEKADDTFDIIIRLLTGVPTSEPVQVAAITTFGKTKVIRQLPLLPHSLITMPFGFDISHKVTEARRLTIRHPLNQLAVAEFYHSHAATIEYYAGLSPFSIRKPVRVARYSNFKDKLHERLLAKQRGQIEENDQEYDQIGSFFVYETYSNVFKFFESYQYHRAEKRFNAMIKIDISKCFDSIYTHSLPWAIHGNRSIKNDLVSSKTTFAGQFDALMQNLNQNETNGIVIGPEFSRVFAELILQSVDVLTEKQLRQRQSGALLHKHDYEIFRYVDDYYIFYNDSQHATVITDYIRNNLMQVKLNLNSEKTKTYEKPIITEITIAKNQISPLIADSIVVKRGCDALMHTAIANGELQTPEEFVCRIDSRSLIVKYKTILKSAGVGYLEVGNYTFALLEGKIDNILAEFVATVPAHRSEDALLRGLVSLMKFAFFIYASAPRVNISIRLTRIVATVTRSFRALAINMEQKHRFYKYIYDNASHQLKKNQALEFREIESLYLLLALGELGKEYWLDERIIRQHLNIELQSDGTYISFRPLNHFTITVLLFYMKGKNKYNALRHFIADQGVSKIEAREHYRHKDAEVLMLALDLMSCPFISNAFKQRIAVVYGLTADDLSNIALVSKNWFTTWSGAELTDELVLSV